jgi:thioredoxin-related protein
VALLRGRAQRAWACALLALAALLAAATPAAAQSPSPHAIDTPPWFIDSFLDIQDEAASVAKDGKRLMLYFGQDGCPYCRELMQTGFMQKPIVDKTRRHFEAVALNIFGDREVTWTDGQRFTEKTLARHLKVQFTPTLLFLDEQGRVTTRLNGYWPPHRLSAALDYVIARQHDTLPLADYLAQHVTEAARAQLNEQPFLMKPPFDLRRKPQGKPLAVLFETRHCQACDEMHAEGFQRAEVRAQLARLDVARFALNDTTELTRPDGGRGSAQAWARELRIAYTPTVVFFDASNREVFRFEGYVRPFHLASAFEYVGSGAYRTQPEFQRFLQHKAERARASGKPVDLWR